MELSNLHVWGCPLFILDKIISDGKKLPHWKPRDSQGIFMGLSQIMQVLFPWSSTWTLELPHHNFMLALMIGSLQLPPVLMISQMSISSAWSKMFGDSEYHFIRDENVTQVDPEDSMTSEAITTRQNHVSKAMDTTMPPTPLPVSPPPSSPSMPSQTPSPVPSSPRLPGLLPLLCLPH